MRRIILHIIFFLTLCVYSQDAQIFLIKGKITDEYTQQPISNVNIYCNEFGTITNKRGIYKLRIDGSEFKTAHIIASHQGYKNDTILIDTKISKLIVNKNIQLQPMSTSLMEIDLISEEARKQGVTKINPKIIEKLPGSSGGIEPVIKLLPGVSSNNELSSQYSVRGGNYDENLIYVNGIQIYKPFLVRTGEQEGLSFVNPNMIASLEFSSGGFQAKYGDKLSSVLDIKYKKPTSNNILLSTSMLGISLNAEGVANWSHKESRKNHKLTYLIGGRIHATNFLLKSLDTEGDYRPLFKDFQTYLTYSNSKYPNWEFSLLNYYSQNKYQMKPQTRESRFGTIAEPLQLTIYFEGQEIDNYETHLAAISSTYSPDKLLKMQFTSSFFNTKEQQFYDILGEYWLDELNNSIGSDELGDIAFNRGIGAYMNHARNTLNASVFNIYHDGRYKFNHKGGEIQWGGKYQFENIEDQIREWEMVDSAGYSISSLNNNNLNLFEFKKGEASIESNRISSYIQFSNNFDKKSHKIYVTFGSRVNYWDVNKELFISPRGTISIKPNWTRDFMFNLSCGSYNQSPFFKEYRSQEGNLNTNISSQKSIHYVINSDYQFKYANRPFKLTTAIYYKKLWDIIPFEIDNLQITYLNENSAKGYATGLDAKLFGEFVKGVDSWISISILKTEEDIEGDGVGYIPRPTDRRLNTSIFFQDYFPNNPNYKMQLSLIYGSGLPYGAPNSQRFQQTARIPSYKRLDIGFSRLIKSEKTNSNVKFINNFKSIWASIEIFNLVDIQNTASYIWVSDAGNDYYAVNNYLTGRLINFKLNIKF